MLIVLYRLSQLKGFSIGQFSQFKTLAQNSFQVSQDYYRRFSRSK